MKFCLTVLFACFVLVSFSQEDSLPQRKFTRLNSFQFDAFGHGLIYSFNYERVFINRDRFKTAAEAGFAYYPFQTNIIGLWIPLSVNQLISFNKHHIELGVGQVLTKDYLFEKKTYPSDKLWGAFGSFKVGYRYQKPSGKFLFKMAFTPFVEYDRDYKNKLRGVFLHPSGGLTFGYCF